MYVLPSWLSDKLSTAFAWWLPHTSYSWHSQEHNFNCHDEFPLLQQATDVESRVTGSRCVIINLWKLSRKFWNANVNVSQFPASNTCTVLWTFPRLAVGISNSLIVIQFVSCICLLECQPSKRWSMRSACFPSLWLRWRQCGGEKRWYPQITLTQANRAHSSEPGVLGLKIDPSKSAVAAGPKLSTLIGLATRFFCEGLLIGVLYIIQQDFVLAYHRWADTLLLRARVVCLRRRKMCMSLSRYNYSYI